MIARIFSASLVLALAGLVAFTAAFAGGGAGGATRPRDEGGCPRDARPTSTTAVLVDFTDAPTPAHRSQVDALLGDLKRQVPVDGKVILAVLTPAAPTGLATVLFEGCNPGTKSGAYTERPTAAPMDQAWLRKFAKPLAEAVERLADASPAASQSPILEAIGELVGRADFDASVTDRHLIVVSDGLQLSPGGYSHFRKGDLWKGFTQSPLAKGIQPDLTGADVRFVYLMRREFAQRQTPAHQEFWARWFTAAGAKAVAFSGGARITPAIN